MLELQSRILHQHSSSSSRPISLLRILLICHNLPSPLFITSLYTSMETTAVSLRSTMREKKSERKDWTVQIMALACGLVIRPCPSNCPLQPQGGSTPLLIGSPHLPPQPTGATITSSVAHSLTAKSASVVQFFGVDPESMDHGDNYENW